MQLTRELLLTHLTSPHGEFLNLNEYTEIHSSAAKLLAEYPGSIELNGLWDLPRNIAKILADFQGLSLSLNGLDRLELEVAKEFRHIDFNLQLKNLRKLTVELAAIFGEMKKFPELECLQVVEDGAWLYIQEKEKWSNHMLYQLSVVGSKVMGKWRTRHIHFKNVKTLSLEDAKQLITWEGKKISFESLTNIDVPLAKVFSKYHCQILFILGPTVVSEEAAVLLLQGRPYVHLHCLKWITPKIAKEIVSQDEYRSYDLDLVLETIDRETAGEISFFKGDKASLFFEKCIDDQVFFELSHLNAKKLVLGIISLSPQGAQFLSQFKGNSLEIADLKELTPLVAKELAKFEGETLCLRDVEDISIECAEALSDSKVELLVFRSLRHYENGFNLEALHKLASFQGKNIQFNWLTHEVDKYVYDISPIFLFKSPSRY